MKKTPVKKPGPFTLDGHRLPSLYRNDTKSQNSFILVKISWGLGQRPGASVA